MFYKSSESPSSQPSGTPSFVEAKKFDGPKPGYYFGSGPRGLGYYVDPRSTARESVSSLAGLGGKSQKVNPYLNSNDNESKKLINNSKGDNTNESNSSGDNINDLVGGRNESRGAEAETVPVVDVSKLTPQQRKLHELKLKHNQCIKSNRSAVEEEFKRVKDPKYDDKKRYLEKVKQEGQSGRLIETSNELDIRADKAIQLKEQEEIKAARKESMGFAGIGSVGASRSYEKNLKKLPTSAVAGGSVMESASVNELDYGSRESSKVDRSNLDRLAKFMTEKEEEAAKRNNKHKMHYEGVETNAINDDNIKFNKRAKKVFDPYTAEIRQNLERGTAI